MNFYITGDTHGRFERYESFVDNFNPTEEDVMIILGDAGLNYYKNKTDIAKKRYVDGYKFTTFCVHGNHEERPENIDTYRVKDFCGGKVFYEEEFPNILFAKDGEVYNFNGKTCLVCGGAYSVDKEYRLLRGYNWFKDEQPSEETKRYVEEQIEKYKHVDFVLTHTCPLKYEPIEMFLSGIDQRKVDKSTEEWLDKVEETLDYDRWYCGHYHTDKEIDKLRFMFNDISIFGT